MHRIAIVNSSSFGRVFPEHLSALEAFAEVDRIVVNGSARLAEMLSGYDGIVASTNPDYPADVLQELPRLKVIARHGIGFNNVDIEAARKLGIIVTKVAGAVERNAVAEHTVALLLSAARWIPQGYDAVRDGRWAERASFIGADVSGSTVGIVGCGNIGSRVAEILHHGFGSDILVHDPYLSDGTLDIPFEQVELAELLRRADFVSLHCAHGSETHHIIGEEQMAAMKPGSILVNSARGELVDDRALLPFLDSGHIRAYAADVVEGEPVGAGHHLCEAENAIVVPHLGGYSQKSSKGMGDTMVENLRSVLVEGRVPAASLVPGLKLENVRS